MTQLIKEVRLLIANGQTEKAIERLLNHLVDQGGPLFNQIILISARYKEIKQKTIALGELDGQAFSGVNQSLLTFLEEWQAEQELFQVEEKPIAYGVAAPAVDPDDKALAQTYFEYGEECLSQFELELAGEAFHTALNYSPDHAGAKFGLEIVEFWTPVNKGALITNEMQQMRLSVLLRRAPNNIALLLMKSNLEWEANEQENAIKIAEEALKINPKSATTLLQLGYYWHSKGDLDMATSFYKSSLDANPKFAIAHNNLGYVYRIRRDFASSVFHLDKAARLNYNLLTLIFLGDSYRYLSDFSQAILVHQNAMNYLATQTEVPQRFYLGVWLMNFMPLIEQEDLTKYHIFVSTPEEKQAVMYFSLALDMAFARNEVAADEYYGRAKALDPQKVFFKFFSNQLESSFEELKVTKESAVFPWMQRIYQELNA